MDTTLVLAGIASASVAIGAIGLGVLVMLVTIKITKWVRGAL
jgi:uncharacterized membrane protein